MILVIVDFELKVLDPLPSLLDSRLYLLLVVNHLIVGFDDLLWRWSLMCLLLSGNGSFMSCSNYINRFFIRLVHFILTRNLMHTPVLLQLFMQLSKFETLFKHLGALLVRV